MELDIKKATPISKTKTYYFILPLLASTTFFENVINCYLGDIINKPKYTLSKIFVQVKDYNENYILLNHFHEYYQLEDDTYMFVYNIPDNFLEDYNKFCFGQFSKMSDDAKDIICKASSVRPIMNSTVYKVLNRTSDQRKFIEDLVGEKLHEDAEVSSIPNMDKEVYNYCKIKEGRMLI